MTRGPVIVVGAGMAGLRCALALHEAGREVRVFEASDDVGGRVRTDEVEGFRLDRGFQVLLTAYPEAREVFDYEALDLRTFEPGALVWVEGDFHRVSDPFRRPQHAFASLRAPVGSFTDKLRIAAVRNRVRQGPVGSIFGRTQTTTREYLRHAGFSESMVERFLRPFLGGIFLERELETSSRMFEFVFRMFSEGETALPARGMAALPRQLSSRLPDEALHLRTRVDEVSPEAVVLGSGERVEADAVVLATSARETARLLQRPAPARGREVTCLYFGAPRASITEPVLLLDGTGAGPVNNVCFPSTLSRELAPEGRELVSLSVVDRGDRDDATLRRDVLEQMRAWFGSDVDAWEFLRAYRIAEALPDQTPESMTQEPRPPRSEEGLYVCGDHCENGSLQAALASGRRAAEAILADVAD